MRPVAVALAPVLVLAAFGCAYSPANGTIQESNAPITIGGWTTAPNTAVTVKARNWNDDSLTVVGTAVSGTSETITGSGLYPWEMTIPASMFVRAHWTPSNLGTFDVAGWTPQGQLDLRPFQGTNAMYTFGPAARQCAWDKMNLGASQRDAGLACSDGTSVSFFDPSGWNVAPAPIEWSLLGQQAYATPNPIVVEVVSYKSGGHTVHAMVCRPDDAVRHRTMVYAHGGAGGTTAFDANVICSQYAQKGWVVAMPSYRGEPLVTPAAWHVHKYGAPAGVDVDEVLPSGGSVETSLGEVMDVHRLLAGLRATAYVASDKMFLWGHSHGGSIALRALETGAQVRAVSARAPATSWAEIHADCGVEPWPNGVAHHSALCTCLAATPATACPGITPMQTAFSGTPTTNRRAYDWRSPRFFTGDLKVRSDVTLFVQHGLADDTVQVSQSCDLFSATYGTGFDKAWHAPSNPADTQGVSALPIADCPGITFQPAPRPTYPGSPLAVTHWQEKRRYLITYDNVNHLFADVTNPDPMTTGNNASNKDFNNFIDWLALTWGT